MNKLAQLPKLAVRTLTAVAAMIVFAGPSYAHTCAQREAQVRAALTDIVALTQPSLSRYCLAHLTLAVVGSIYNPHSACPLEIDEVASDGFLVKKAEGQVKCKYQAGDIISGVLTQDAETNNAMVYLEE